MSWQQGREADVAPGTRSVGEASNIGHRTSKFEVVCAATQCSFARAAQAGAEPLLIISAIEAPTIEQETREEEAIDVPWQVVVHNDPVNLMSYVTMVFQKVFGFSRERAEKHMLEVHREGRSVVWSGLRERAELYVQQLHGYLLLATVERPL
jgi:ATP-dependent Clp protease adaptor protein ClpS